MFHSLNPTILSSRSQHAADHAGVLLHCVDNLWQLRDRFWTSDDKAMLVSLPQINALWDLEEGREGLHSAFQRPSWSQRAVVDQWPKRSLFHLSRTRICFNQSQSHVLRREHEFLPVLCLRMRISFFQCRASKREQESRLKQFWRDFFRILCLAFHGLIKNSC